MGAATPVGGDVLSSSRLIGQAGNFCHPLLCLPAGIVHRARKNIMDKKKVETVVQLCDELKKRVQAWKETSKGYKFVGRDGKIHVSMYGPPKEPGALRRCSMELTRALAEMRRP